MRGIQKSEYLWLFLLAAAVCAAIVAIAAFTPAKTGGGASDTLGVLSGGSPESDGAIGVPDGDVIFRVSDADTLRLLIASGAFPEFYAEHGELPTVVIEGPVTLDDDVVFDCCVRLIITGRLDGGGRIRFSVDGGGKIVISSNENVQRFDIDAPDCELIMTGGDIPYLYEAAELENVASYNGSPTENAAGGDTLGGRGRARALGATLYADKKKQTARDGAYSEVTGNLITLYVPHDVSDSDMKRLPVEIEVDGGECSLDDAIDLSSPKLVSVVDGAGEERVYRLTARRARLDIPILCLYTDDGSEIDSKENYKSGYMVLDGETYTLSVKGRGNASWNTFPKHSYRIKLDKKAKLCSMTADRDWCLIGNYVDPSLLRNKVASEMAKSMSGLPYTPEYRSVDLFINGKYEGIFMLSEKIEDDEDRVPLGERVVGEAGKIADLGFLIEFGWDFSSENVWSRDYFDTDYCLRMYIKEPELTEPNTAEYRYIRDYVKAAEAAIVKGEGYEDYIDVDSWVDWFIVNELTYNTECAFYRSLYMYKPVGGKLTAGPIWDYDMAFGNNLIDRSDYKGWCSVDYVSSWMYENWACFLVKSDDFMARVRARWREVRDDLLDTAKSALFEEAALIEPSVPSNFKRWDKVLNRQIGNSRASTLGFSTWRQHVDYIESFLDSRAAEIDRLLA